MAAVQYTTSPIKIDSPSNGLRSLSLNSIASHPTHQSQTPHQPKNAHLLDNKALQQVYEKILKSSAGLMFECCEQDTSLLSDPENRQGIFIPFSL